MIFVNLPVADIERSRMFFADLGYAFNEKFSGDTAVMLVLGENQFAMLIQRDAFDALHPRRDRGRLQGEGVRRLPEPR